MYMARGRRAPLSDTATASQRAGRGSDGHEGEREGAPSGERTTLATAFDPRRNSLAVMRLGLAGVVAVAHALGVGFGWQPHLGATALSDFAVDGFFVLSGFLVTGSFLRLRSPGRFVWHRFLRIMPGFWICLVVTAVIAAPAAAVLVGQPPASVFTTDEDPAWRYVVANAALPILQYEIAGITASNGETVFDGSLWTLQYEAFCYGVLWLLGVMGILRGSRGAVLGVCVAVWATMIVQHLGLIPFDVPLLANDQVLRLLLVFLLGAAAYLFADVVLVRGTWALVGAAMIVISSFSPDYRVVGALPFAYLCVYAMVRLPVTWTPTWDLSYGLYVYHWPVELLLLLAGATAFGSAAFVLLSLAGALALAALSWVLVEGPALRLKGASVPWTIRGHRTPWSTPRA